MKCFTLKEINSIFEIIEKCLTCASEQSLITDILLPVRNLIPHESIICCIGTSSLKVTVFLNLNYPEEFLRIYLKDLIHTDPLIKIWMETWKPQIWKDIYKRYKNELIKNLSREFSLNNGISHGLPDIGKNFATHFSLCKSPEKIHQRFSMMLGILVPHIHQAFIRVYENKISKFLEHTRCKDDGNNNIMLTWREMEILKWAKEGKTNWEISKILGISERTVKFHFSNIFQKMDVVNRGQAIAKALELDLIKL